MNNHITNKLIELVKEKHIAKYILDMKYEMEHKEKMIKICKNIKEMTCVVLNTVDTTDIEENTPIQTHIIFHERLEEGIQMEESVENYVFAFQPYEIGQYRYINNIIQKKGEKFLNKEEYLRLFDIITMEESNL